MANLKSGIQSVAISPTEKLAAICVLGQPDAPEVIVLDLTDGHVVTRIRFGVPRGLISRGDPERKYQPVRAAFSPDGSMLALTFQGVIKVFSVSSWSVLTELEAPLEAPAQGRLPGRMISTQITAVTFPDSRHIVAAYAIGRGVSALYDVVTSFDASIAVVRYDLESRQPVWVQQLGRFDSVVQIVTGSSRHAPMLLQLFLAGRASVFILDQEDGRILHRFDNVLRTGELPGLAVSPDGTVFYALVDDPHDKRAGFGGCIAQYDIKSEQVTGLLCDKKWFAGFHVAGERLVARKGRSFDLVIIDPGTLRVVRVIPNPVRQSYTLVQPLSRGDAVLLANVYDGRLWIVPIR